MPTGQMGEVLRQLRRAVLLRDKAGLTDGQLLEVYVRHRDDTAMEVLVRRHGPMVWGVCRRVLRHHHDAEDAFQATFLVLARKAASIRSRELLAPWLYGVAHRTALKARARRSRREGRERRLADLPEPAAAGQDSGEDMRPLLDREVKRLPDRYRVLIVLCALEGQTRKEAARQLGLPEGTVASRLARARALLAKRLARYGLGVSAAALAGMLSQDAAGACLPGGLTGVTVRAATRVAAGEAATGGVVSAQVAALAQGVLRSMLLNKLKAALAVVLAAGVLGAAGLVYQTRAADGPARHEDTIPRGAGREPQPGDAAARAPDPGGAIGIRVVARPADGTVVVEEVFPGSPAARAGIQSGDVIVKVDNEEVKGNVVRAVRKIRGVAPGREVAIEIERTLKVRVEKPSGSPPRPPTPPGR